MRRKIEPAKYAKETKNKKEYERFLKISCFLRVSRAAKSFDRKAFLILFSDRIIKFRQNARGNSERVKSLKKRPFRESPEKRAIFETFRRGRDRQIDMDETSFFLELFDEIQIFEKRQRFESADLFVDFAADENRRIAVDQSGRAQIRVKPR